MNRFVFVMIAALLLAASCSKKQQVAGPADARGAQGGDVLDKSPAISGTEHAEGDLHEALLELKKVYFPFDGADLVPESRQALEQAARRLTAHPEVRLCVDGNTDARGTSEYNMGLGFRRAQAVVSYMRSFGVAAVALSPASFGEEQPAATGNSSRDLALNRRVEFRLLRGDIELVLVDGTPLDDTGLPLN
jgi:peptidoglycan-associated lipoprotein